MTRVLPTETAPAPQSKVSEGVRRKPSRWHRHRYTPEERRRLLESLFPKDRWRFRFWWMLAMSMVIAVMGLTANSVAAVIGAMLIAPLMTPVMAVAAALTMGWGRRASLKALTVVAASIASVALAYLLAAFVRSQPLTSEVLIRTSPDGRDFLIALAAGLAGAYATAREDVSVALPGVAVAVALAPPLAVIGITLEAGRTDLAGGALLLYTTNLVTILLAGMVVFLATGFVPLPRLRHAGASVISTFVVVSVVAVAVGIPLAVRSAEAAESAQRREQVNRAVFSWRENAGDVDVEDVEIDGDSVTVDLTGPGEPPDSVALVESLRREIGPAADVEIRWRTVSMVEVDDQSEPDPQETITQIEAAVRPLVGDWLATGDVDDVLDVTAVTVADESASRVEIELAGPALPPPVAPLAEAVSEELGRSVEVQVLVIEREVFDPSTDPDPDALEMAAAVRESVEDWANVNDVDILDSDLDFSDGRVEIDVAGERAPSATRPMVRALREITGDEDLAVDVRFVTRVVLPLTAPTTTSPTTAAPAPAGSVAGEIDTTDTNASS